MTTKEIIEKLNRIIELSQIDGVNAKANIRELAEAMKEKLDWGETFTKRKEKLLWNSGTGDLTTMYYIIYLNNYFNKGE